MRMDVLWLAVFAALHAGAGAAQACSCGRPTSSVAQQLRSAQEDAVAIYRARVHATSPDDVGGTASAEVLEVFKGPFTPGERITLQRGNGVSCGYVFRAGVEYLIYAYDTPTRAEECSRTRPATAAAEDLLWFRTGKAPPEPVSLQREVVSCTPCDLNAVGGRLMSPPEAAPGQRSEPRDAEIALKKGEPFLTFSSPSTDEKRFVLVGRSWMGKHFELTRTPHLSNDTACEEKIHLRWCQSLKVSTSSPDGRPEFQCVKPGKASRVCDETRTREAAWMPLEAIPLQGCEWDSADSARCRLKAERLPPPDAAPRSPVLQCRPSDLPFKKFTDVHRCAVKDGPLPTARPR